jgi:putative phosphoesterase
MHQILLISDTHGFWDSKLDQLLESKENSSHPVTDEIWHAGDIGSTQIIEKLEKTNKRLRLVSGNIDGVIFKKVAPEFQIFTWGLGGKKFLITHIAGKPLQYLTHIQHIIEKEKPDFLIAGHSHILRVMWDKKYNLLYINPGACGNEGIHKVKTALRFSLDEIGNMHKLEIVEWRKF